MSLILGGLTDDELRASPVPVSGPVTDAELRAEPVPTASLPMEYIVRHTGQINGKAAEVVTILGYRRQWSSTSAYGDVCPYLVGGKAKFNTPDIGTTYYAVSTSVQDATGGTGQDRLRMEYLDAAGVTQSMVINLNGTTAVSIGSGISFIQMMEAYHSVSSDRECAGNVTISSINGAATEATTMEMIRAGGNRSQSFRYKIPIGRHAHLIDYHVSAVKLSGGGTTEHTFNVRATVFNDLADGVSTSYHFLKGASISDGGGHSDEFHYKELPAGSILKLSDIPSAIADGNIITASLDFILMDD